MLSHVTPVSMDQLMYYLVAKCDTMYQYLRKESTDRVGQKRIVFDHS